MTQTHTFPAEKAHQLDTIFRRWLQNPFKILSPFVQQRMTVIDYGCGNGYFSLPLSKMVGNFGHVYSIDIQQEMLDKLVEKLTASSITNVTPILKEHEKLNISAKIDFALAVYVVHEISDQKGFFKEMFDLLKPGGQLLVIEPDFIVSKRKFNKTLEFAEQVGFTECEKLNLILSKSRLLMKTKNLRD